MNIQFSHKMTIQSTGFRLKAACCTCYNSAKKNAFVLIVVMYHLCKYMLSLVMLPSFFNISSIKNLCLMLYTHLWISMYIYSYMCVFWVILKQQVSNFYPLLTFNYIKKKTKSPMCCVLDTVLGQFMSTFSFFFVYILLRYKFSYCSWFLLHLP